MRRAAAEIIAEFGPFEGIDGIHGVTYDGTDVWFASDDRLTAISPADGRPRRTLNVPASAGTTFDGTHIFQIAGDRIQKIDPATGRVLSTIPAPGGNGVSGLAWGEGSLWVGESGERRIHEVDPRTGTVLRTLKSDRFVTGVTWAAGELWHGTWENDASDLRRIDPETSEVLEVLDMPHGSGVSGLEFDGADRFYCGGGSSGTIRAVRRPR